jgi:hypothetical protein
MLPPAQTKRLTTTMTNLRNRRTIEGAGGSPGSWQGAVSFSRDPKGEGPSRQHGGVRCRDLQAASP